MLDARNIQRKTGHQHQRVRDADCAEHPRRARPWNRHHQQRQHQRAGKPVGKRRRRPGNHVARRDETQEGDHGKRHRHGRKRTLMLQGPSMKPIAQAGIGQLLR
ncbi:hypothetical protein ACT2FY_24685 [Paraburkholderia fungorum]|uniref:hypothetical protein n=1 Tax=Paraburkholderia fungorum TaxID=134537 RepID=UPI00402B6529